MLIQIQFGARKFAIFGGRRTRDQHRFNSCVRKVRYGHEATARKALSAMEAKGVDDLDVYECDYCGGWHLGH
jgi:hypothetical protein